MKQFLLLLIIGLFFVNAEAQKSPNYDRLLRGVDRELEALLEDWHIAGFAVAVVDKNGPVYVKGFGYRDLENKLPVNEHTLFAIGSCTKAFTSSLLGLLEKEGELKLDDPPSKYIKELSFSTDELNAQITIEDLMAHRTGLPRHDFAWYFFPTFSRDSLVARIAHQKPWTGVRERWYYNNFMFLLQGVIAERLTEKSWEDLIDQQLFSPLGMERSNVSIEELMNSDNASLGYEDADGDIRKMDYYRIAGMAPAGSINSSVAEMSRWVQTWINGGKYQDSVILPSQYVRRAISSHAVITPALPDAEQPDLFLANYGYGWMLSSYKGHYRVEHGGNIDGFSASTSFFPSDSVGIVVLTNQNGSPVTSLARNILADRLLGVETTDWNARMKKQREEREKAQEEVRKNQGSSRVEGTSPSHVLPEYTGTYSNEGYGEFKIETKGDSLFVRFPEKSVWLKHHHYDVFKAVLVRNGRPDTVRNMLDGIMFNFQIEAGSGDIKSTLINLEPALQEPLEFTRQPNELDVSAEDLEKYTGDYVLGPQQISIYVKEEKLFAFLPGQPEYELVATEEDTFIFKVLQGFKIEFSEEENGKMQAATFVQPNGRFKASRKD